MNKKFIFLFFFVCLLHTIMVRAQTRSISKEEVLTLAQQQFKGQDVDYYVLDDSTTKVWKVFVDAEPMKGWFHKCYTLTIPMIVSMGANSISVGKTANQIPPSGNFVPLSVKSRHLPIEAARTIVPKSPQSNIANPAASRTYAIILSGGINKISNYERYWNDCSFIYQTLTNKYGIPKDNIVPLMSDGSNPSEDMNCGERGFKSQPLDLDFDGVDEISLSATTMNLKQTLTALYGEMGEDDHLFLFVIDHGGTYNNVSNSFICLWNNDQLSDVELASYLTSFSKKRININVVLGQCFAGGFIDNLQKAGCVVSAACRGNESSWACADIPYDEFVYQWTSAVNEGNHVSSFAVRSDADNNGRVTMLEAFDYAVQHDRREAEHPQYSSVPLSVGQDLAFNHLVPAVDLYVKDDPADTGIEPNTTCDGFWKSPSICVRNQDDSIFIHENPEYTKDHQLAFVYVKVYNRGKDTYTGGKWAHVYWAQASTGLTPKAWKGREVYNGKNVTGGHLEAASIPDIAPGDSALVKVRWALPQLLEDYPEGNFHFCLYVKLLDTPYDDTYVEGQTKFNARISNDEAQKNVTIISKTKANMPFSVYVRNVSAAKQSYSLELVPQTLADKRLFDYATVEMQMSPKVYAAWERGGFKSQDVQVTVIDNNSTSGGKVKLVSPQSSLQSINMNGDEFDLVSLKFEFKDVVEKDQTFTYDLIQKDEDGNIIGGETFVVEAPTLAAQSVVITQKVVGGGILLSTNASPTNTFTWLNAQGDNVGTTESITVTPKPNANTYSVVVLGENGEAATASVSLDVMHAIKSVSASAADITIELQEGAPNGATVFVASVLDGTVKASADIPAGNTSATLCGLSLQKGIYVVGYAVDGETMDQQKISIQ